MFASRESIRLLRRVNPLLLVFVIDGFLFALLYSSSVESTNVAIAFSTKAFFLGGIITGIGGTMGVGWAETKIEMSTVGMGVEVGPGFVLDRVKERPEMRKRQMSQGFWVLLVGLPIFLASLLAIPFY